MNFAPIILNLLCVLTCLVGCLPHEYMDQFGEPMLNSYSFDDLKYTVRRNFGESETWEDFRRVCYLRMDPKTKIQFDHIDGNLCTHIIFAFCRIDSEGKVVFGADTDEQYLLDVTKLKAKYPHLRILISLYNEEESQGFVKASNSRIIRERLSHSAIDFMHRYQLDGMDLDWEFPNFPQNLLGRRTNERHGFTQILVSLRKSFGNRYLLTSAVAAQELVFRASYELDKVAEQVDWLNVMTYDYYLYNSYTPFTGPNSPLYSIGSGKVPILNHLSIDWTIKEYLRLGVPRKKIVMGIPTYSRGFKLLKTAWFKSPRPFIFAVGSKGGHEVSDYFNFKEVCKFLLRPDTKTYFDEQARVPYMSAEGSLWISYESEQSIREKVGYAIGNGLAGYMTWNLNSDNFNEPCHPQDFRRNILHNIMMDQARKLINISL